MAIQLAVGILILMGSLCMFSCVFLDSRLNTSILLSTTVAAKSPTHVQVDQSWQISEILFSLAIVFNNISEPHKKVLVWSIVL